MTKQELVGVLARRSGLKFKDAEIIINLIFDTMKETFKEGKRLEIRGFGSFSIKHHKSYEGRNPKTGEKVIVPEKSVPRFKVGKELREMLTSGGTEAVEGSGSE